MGRGIALSTALIIVALASGCAPAPSSGNYTSTSGPTAAPAEAPSSVWQEYADTDGDSGITEYEIGGDYVRVRFSDGSIYLYTYASAGESDIEAMKQLAQAGDGLNSYILRNAKYDYESKQR